MADKIFGVGLDPIPLKLVPTPEVIPAFGAEPRPVYIADLSAALESVTSAEITDATTVGRAVLTAADAAAARTAIGAGTPYTLPAATTAVAGGVKKTTAIAASTAVDTAGIVTDFNALVTALRVAGIVT